MSWLDCSCNREGSKKLVNKLRCKVCSEFVDRIKGISNKWTVGADKRSQLHVTNQSLDDLLWVLSSKVPLKSFNSDDSIDLWWLGKRKRLTQSERKEYRPHRSQTAREESTSSEIQSESESEDMLEQWDELTNDIWVFFVFFCVTGHMCHLSNHFLLCSDICPHIHVQKNTILTSGAVKTKM